MGPKNGTMTASQPQFLHQGRTFTFLPVPVVELEPAEFTLGGPANVDHAIV